MKKRIGKGSASMISIILLLMLLLFGLLLLGAKLILAGVIGENQLLSCAAVIAAVGSFAVSLCSALRSPRKKLLWGLCASAGFFLALLVSNLLFFGIEYSNVLTIAACVLGGGLLGSLLGRKKVRKYA